MELQDPTFGVNDFDLPKVLSTTETYARNVLLLLFGKPGFYPSIPTLGMDIQQYLYMFVDDINTDSIKTKLATQCKDFLPELQTGDFDVQKRVVGGRPLLAFILPIVEDNSTINIALGVTTNAKGELVYRYVDNDRTQIL